MKVLLCICAVLAVAAGQRITTIQLEGVQYFVSRMNPYSPELNYFLAYQYCRSLGLQLASFETREKVESMTQYLQNAGYSNYDFWTSGNRLGTGMFLWMSTGLPFNATFDYFESSNVNQIKDNIDPLDQNANTAPQRTARDSSSGLEKGCVVMKAPNLKWAPEDCSAVKDFICEQTRCYYYNYGSIPVSSAQGRPITTTTTPSSRFFSSTTLATPIAMSLNLNADQQAPLAALRKKNLNHEKEDLIERMKATKIHLRTDMEETLNETKEEDEAESEAEEPTEAITESEVEENETVADSGSAEVTESQTQVEVEQTTTVEQRLKQITEEVEKLGTHNEAPVAKPEVGPQSFFSLSDLIKNLRPNDKVSPQIDSDYSNTMRVLGETASLVQDESRKFRNSQQQINRSLY